MPKRSHKVEETPTTQPEVALETKYETVDIGSSETEDDALYVGIDLGSLRSAIFTSGGTRKIVFTIVGWPKDRISQKILQKSILFGEEALENRLALDLYRPVEFGMIKTISEDAGESSQYHYVPSDNHPYSMINTLGKASKEDVERDFNKNKEALGEFLKHLIGLGDAIPGQKIYGVICAPPAGPVEDKKTLIDMASEVLDRVSIVSGPFAVAYGLGNLNHSLVVDIGAGSIDICRIPCTMPTDSDQRTLFCGGNYIDNKLVELLEEKYEGAQLTRNMARKWKEALGRVSTANEAINLEVIIGDVSQLIDIKEELSAACESVVPKIVESIRELISTYHPEFQKALRNNIILAGGCSQITDLDTMIANGLQSIAGATVTPVPDPVFISAEGALKLAREMSEEQWQYKG